MVGKNISIVFSGYNIKSVASFAIDTFIKQYPELKNNIIYFDDFSTDGSKAHFIKKGVKVITWKKEEIEQYNSLLNKNFFKNDTHTLSVRVSFILNSIFKQLETKYVLMNDGDVAFYERGFLEKYFELLNDGYQAVGMFVAAYLSEFQDVPLINEQYKMMSQSEYKNVLEKFNTDKQSIIQSFRLSHTHSFYDLEYLKTIGIFADSLEESVLEKITGDLFDTNIDFTSKLISANTKIKPIYKPPIVHWFGCSCEQRGFVKGTIGEDNHYVYKTQEYNGETVFTIDLNKPREHNLPMFNKISNALCSGYTLETLVNKNEIYRIILKKII